MPAISDRIRRHLADPESHHRRIATSFLWVSFFVIVGKLAGAAKEMAIAWRYGISETVDAYLFVFNLINWPIGIWFSVLTVVLIPLAVKARNGNPSALPRFRSELLALTLVAGVALGGLAYWGLPLLFAAGWAGLSGGGLRAALAMAGPLSLLLPLGLAISVFSAWMMAGGHHSNTLLEALPALAILVVLLLPPGWVPEPLVWGSVAGFALQLAGLGWPLWRQGELQSPKLGFHSPAWQGFWGSVGIMAIGQALMSLTGIIDQFFAAHVGPGAISTLSYASRIVALVLGLGAMAISRATLPIFSEIAAKGNVAAIRSLAMKWAKLMFLLGLAITAVTWILAPWIVEVLFQRGAFNETNTTEVSSVMRLYLLQTPIYFYALVLVAVFSSQRKYGVLLVTGVIGVLIKPLSNLVLVPYFGVNGIALGVPIVYAATSVYMTWRLKAV